MRVYELSPRLQSVADLVPEKSKLADIGTDHAYLPVWLILKGILDTAIAADLREGPLERARETARHYGVESKLSFRLCDGLSGIEPGEAEVISIAGMGGETIATILEMAPWTAAGDRRLILQPMTAQETLRSWLCSHGYTIKREILTCEGKTLYNTMLVMPGKMEPLTPAECWAGRQEKGMNSPLRGRYLEKLMCRAERALEGAQRSGKAEDAARSAELKLVAEGIRAMKKEWDGWQV